MPATFSKFKLCLEFKKLAIAVYLKMVLIQQLFFTFKIEYLIRKKSFSPPVINGKEKNAKTDETRREICDEGEEAMQKERIINFCCFLD